MRTCHPERREGAVWVGGTKQRQRTSRPHRFLATLGMTMALACKTATPPPAAPAAQPQPKETPASAMADVAGESTDTAVEVPADAPNGGVDFENNWMFDRFGRFRRRGGGTGTLNNRRYNVVDIELPNGDTKKIYFDITENWKRWSPP